MHAQEKKYDDGDDIFFGKIVLNPELEKLRQFMNLQVPQLCLTMPKHLQSPSILLLQRQYAGYSLINLKNFYDLFLPPVWTVIYWLHHNGATLTRAELNTAAQGQAMAMLVHMLDDHLADAQLQVGHLILQLRTRAWQVYEDSYRMLARNITGGEKLAEELIDVYFSGVHAPPVSECLEDYMELARKEMATGLVIPMLIASRIGNQIGIRQSLESFGIAWRLGDDLKDWVMDAKTGQITAIFHKFSKESRILWNSCKGMDDNAPEFGALYKHINENRVFDELKFRVRAELENASSVACELGLDGLASEYRTLAEPLKQLYENTEVYPKY